MFYWHINPRPKSERTESELDGYVNDQSGENAVSAYTCAELGEMLPKKVIYVYSYIEDGYSYKIWSCTARYRESSKDSYINTICGETEAEARAKMLIYLIEQKLIEVKK